MINVFLRNIVRFFFLVLLQVLVLNHVHLFSLYNPFFYLLFIVLLPFETNKLLVLLLGFVLGLSIDIFSNTLGLHTTATVFVAFIRPLILNLLAPREGYEPGSFPRVHYYGWTWFLRYSFILTLVHALIIYTLEFFNVQELGQILKHSLISTLFTTVLLLISQFFIFRK